MEAWMGHKYVDKNTPTGRSIEQLKHDEDISIPLGNAGDRIDRKFATMEFGKRAYYVPGELQDSQCYTCSDNDISDAICEEGV
jgi:hypothetical protein